MHISHRQIYKITIIERKTHQINYGLQHEYRDWGGGIAYKDKTLIKYST